MIDLNDSVTAFLPQPTRKQFVSGTRIYTAILDQDLLGDWTVMQSWSGRGAQNGGGKTTLVENFDAGMKALQEIARKCLKQGYEPINQKNTGL